ncbi:putative protein serine/threonine kinase [Tieghemostelium lacteum]|uniref:Swt1-like HEPN domain-containing protein n=1 Tax=Tieghemostelium lacteum TaxID=361077 RepID=A0A151Z5P2_TIELA|nr:putative protein serine/threonine kinase [Tieghemostelium lacteum]|eukprot:KYQ89276.1 putative protein serine/threonine kinase [Tieghemostelium lacteum]
MITEDNFSEWGIDYSFNLIGKGLNTLRDYLIDRYKGIINTKLILLGAPNNLIQEAKTHDIVHRNRFDSSSKRNDDIDFNSWDVTKVLLFLNKPLIFQSLSVNKDLKTSTEHSFKNLIHDIIKVRNDWAHQQPISMDDVYKFLDNIERVYSFLGSPERETSINSLKYTYLIFTLSRKCDLSFNKSSSPIEIFQLLSNKLNSNNNNNNNNIINKTNNSIKFKSPIKPSPVKNVLLEQNQFLATNTNHHIINTLGSINLNDEVVEIIENDTVPNQQKSRGYFDPNPLKIPNSSKRTYDVSNSDQQIVDFKSHSTTTSTNKQQIDETEPLVTKKKRESNIESTSSIFSHPIPKRMPNLPNPVEMRKLNADTISLSISQNNNNILMDHSKSWSDTIKMAICTTKPVGSAQNPIELDDSPLYPQSMPIISPTWSINNNTANKNIFNTSSSNSTNSNLNTSSNNSINTNVNSSTRDFPPLKSFNLGSNNRHKNKQSKNKRQQNNQQPQPQLQPQPQTQAQPQLHQHQPSSIPIPSFQTPVQLTNTFNKKTQNNKVNNSNKNTHNNTREHKSKGSDKTEISDFNLLS